MMSETPWARLLRMSKPPVRTARNQTRRVDVDKYKHFSKIRALRDFQLQRAISSGVEILLVLRSWL